MISLIFLHYYFVPKEAIKICRVIEKEISALFNIVHLRIGYRHRVSNWKKNENYKKIKYPNDLQWIRFK